MIQLVVNVNLLREIDERKLINAYARYMYNDEFDINDDIRIRENLIQILDWDENGDSGLGIYCGRFESIKNKDWDILINTIKVFGEEIAKISESKSYLENRKLEHNKQIYSEKEKSEERLRTIYSDPNYTTNSRGIKAKPCEYNGKVYQSRFECMYKENITKAQLYKYLALSGQLDSNSSLAKKYIK